MDLSWFGQVFNIQVSFGLETSQHLPHVSALSADAADHLVFDEEQPNHVPVHGGDD